MRASYTREKEVVEIIVPGQTLLEEEF